MRSVIGMYSSSALLLLAAGVAHADGSILASEVMPELAGSELGALPIADAPPPGTSKLVRRGDVLRALAGAGLSAEGLSIPRATRVSRALLRLAKAALLEQAREALTNAAAPCALQDARVSADAQVLAGPRQITAELPKRGSPLQTSTFHVTGAIFIDSGGQRVRIPVVASLSCPPPEVQSGTQLTVFAQVGLVRASAPAEARQHGRVGEIIRVTNRATGATLRARVLDAHSCEVVQ